MTKGTAPYMSATYDWATNRRVGATYDANGNEYGPSGYTEYDRENRMTRYDASASYGYNASNQRVYEAVWSGGGVVRDRLTFYGLSGERMATYERTVSPSYTAFAPLWVSVYFGGKLIEQNGQRVVQDRLGSTVVHGSERLGYWPYGQEKPGATTNSRDKFATYWRDATGLDYAMNRYYSGGRFMTPDPLAPGEAETPRSWHQYSYGQNDPVQTNDRSGLLPAGAQSNDGMTGMCVKYYSPPGGTVDASQVCPAGYMWWTFAQIAGQSTRIDQFLSLLSPVMEYIEDWDWADPPKGASIDITLSASTFVNGILPQVAATSTAGLGGMILLGGGPITWTVTVTGAVVLTGVYLHQTGTLSALLYNARSILKSKGQDPDCEKEWKEAFDMCQKLLSEPQTSSIRGITGGTTTVADCARGLVSERCGGNPTGR